MTFNNFWADLGNKILDIKYYISDVLWDELIRNPLFLTAVGIFFILSIIKGWKNISLIIFSVVSVTLVTHFLLPEDFGLSNLFPFVGGILAVGAIGLYFFFVKSK